MKLFTAMEAYSIPTYTGLSVEELSDRIDSELTTIGTLSNDLVYAYEAHEQLVKLERLGGGNNTLRTFTMETIALQLGYPVSTALEADGVGSKIKAFAVRVWEGIKNAWKKVKNWVLGLFGKGEDNLKKAEDAKKKNNPTIEQYLETKIGKSVDPSKAEGIYKSGGVKALGKGDNAFWNGLKYEAKLNGDGTCSFKSNDKDVMNTGTTKMEFLQNGPFYDKKLKEVTAYKDAVLKVKPEEFQEGHQKDAQSIINAIGADVKKFVAHIKLGTKIADGIPGEKPKKEEKKEEAKK